LILAAAELSRRAPEQWAEFMIAFVVYASGKRDECVQAPLAMLPVAQGRAQAIAQLEVLFDECKVQSENITKKQKPQLPR
jgi:hypothetical protein